MVPANLGPSVEPTTEGSISHAESGREEEENRYAILSQNDQSLLFQREKLIASLRLTHVLSLQTEGRLN